MTVNYVVSNTVQYPSGAVGVELVTSDLRRRWVVLAPKHTTRHDLDAVVTNIVATEQAPHKPFLNP